MKRTDPRIYLGCRFFYVTTAEEGYSERTPGSDFAMGCNKDHWSFDPFVENEVSMYKKLKMAVVCEDYSFDSSRRSR